LRVRPVIELDEAADGIPGSGGADMVYPYRQGKRASGLMEECATTARRNAVVPDPEIVDKVRRFAEGPAAKTVDRGRLRNGCSNACFETGIRIGFFGTVTPQHELRSERELLEIGTGILGIPLAVCFLLDTP